MISSRHLHDKREARHRAITLEKSVGRPTQDHFLIGKSQPIREVNDLVERYAKTDETILITGESGTGKTLLAERIHALSNRSKEACGSVSLCEVANSIAQSKIFGHVRGSFTDALATRPGMLCKNNRGTLILDELGKCSLEIQSQLLNILEHRGFYPVGSDMTVKVDVRFVMAMSEKPDELLHRKRLLQDLWARVKWFQIALPPVRDRREDIPEILKFMAAKHARTFGYEQPPMFSDELLKTLVSWHWPYNFRGLDFVVRLLLTHAGGAPVLDRKHMVGPALEEILGSTKKTSRIPSAARMIATVRQEGSVLGASRQLGVARNTVKRHLKKSEEGRSLLLQIRRRSNSARAAR